MTVSISIFSKCLSLEALCTSHWSGAVLTGRCHLMLENLIDHEPMMVEAPELQLALLPPEKKDIYSIYDRRRLWTTQIVEWFRQQKKMKVGKPYSQTRNALDACPVLRYKGLAGFFFKKQVGWAQMSKGTLSLRPYLRTCWILRGKKSWHATLLLFSNWLAASLRLPVKLLFNHPAWSNWWPDIRLILSFLSAYCLV